MVYYNDYLKVAMYNNKRLLTKREINMARYWPSSFLCLFMDLEAVEFHYHAETERKRPITGHVDGTSLVNKGFIRWH